MSNTDFLGRAIDVVKKAIESDTAGEYEKAYQQYYNARAWEKYHLYFLTNTFIISSLTHNTKSFLTCPFSVG